MSVCVPCRSDHKKINFNKLYKSVCTIGLNILKWVFSLFMQDAFAPEILALGTSGQSGRERESVTYIQLAQCTWKLVSVMWFEFRQTPLSKESAHSIHSLPSFLFLSAIPRLQWPSEMNDVFTTISKEEINFSCARVGGWTHVKKYI